VIGVSFTAVEASALSASVYGPSTPASRSAVTAWLMAFGYSRTSEGRASAGFDELFRMPVIPAAA